MLSALSAGCGSPSPARALAPPAVAAGPKPEGEALGAPPTPGGRVGSHGMVAFGGEGGPVYFHHLPMFHRPHDMQVIAEVELDGGPGRFDTALYTFEPTPFSLDDLLLGRLSTIAGTLYEGNFEHEGRPLAKVNARPRRVVVAKPLDGRAASPETLEYMAVGSRKNAFLFHPITRAPDFDQVLAVDVSQTALSDEQLRVGVMLAVPGRKNVVAERLRGGSIAVAIKGGAPAARTPPPAAPEGQGPEARLEVRRVLSTLVGPRFVDGP